MYTAELIKDIYFKTLKAIDNEIWWICIRDETLVTYNDVLIKAAELAELKLTSEDNHDKKDNREESSNITSNFARASDVTELAQQFRTLALLVNKQKPQRPLSEVLCHNCNQMGHYANNCTAAPRERDRRLPRDHQQQERSPATGSNAVPLGNRANGQGFLARDEQNAFATKRMRMENLVNEKDVNSVGINTKKVYGLDPKKIKNSKITKFDSNSLVERILNEPAPITTRELLKI